MPTHWTYKEFKPEDDLFQGDIIAREPLLGVLDVVHRHFADPKYLAFIVLTQTCDLVLRRSRCKAGHISLAVVRPLSALMSGLLEEMCQSPRAGLFSKERRKDAEEFLHRVLNQNEQAQGWVYLHPDADVGIGEHAAAMLRISISLRANEHYELIRKARCGRLDTEYRNKLGWLKGNLYSRIDTTDWSERESGDEQEKAIIRDLLDAPVAGRPPLWVPTAWINEARKKENLDQILPQNLDLVLRQYAPKPPLEVALSEVKRLIDLVRMEFTDHPVEVFCTRIENDPCIIPMLSQTITQIVGSILGPSSKERQWSFYEFLAGDKVLHKGVVAGLRKQATKFLSQPGRRNVQLFINSLAGTTIVTVDLVDRMSYWAEEAFGADYLSHHDQTRSVFLGMMPPASMVEYLRNIAIACVQDSLAERVAARLTNSPPFKKTMKPE